MGHREQSDAIRDRAQNPERRGDQRQNFQTA